MFVISLRMCMFGGDKVDFLSSVNARMFVYKMCID